MRLADIWWQQVGSSLRLCRAIVRQMETETSFVLRLPRRLPWQDTFYDRMQDSLSSLRADRTLRFLTCTGAAPGRQILEELCSEEVRAGYWPDQSYARYLAALPELTLNHMYVWVRQISTPGQLEQWRSFAAQYAAAAAEADEPGPHALFVLEYRTKHPSAAAADEVGYRISGGDCQVFSLEAAALAEGLPAEYLATMAQCAGGGDPELAGALIREGEAFLRSPVDTVQQILAEGCTESGEPFAPADVETLHLRIWRAQMMVLFAQLEEKRLNYIRTNYARLKSWLPNPDEKGGVIDDPYDLEYGNLFYMTRRPDTDFSRQESEEIRLCRDVRNLLAHNELVPCDQALRLLEQTS